jgi:hypothetical protein
MLPLLHPRFVIRRKDATGVPSGQPQYRACTIARLPGLRRWHSARSYAGYTCFSAARQRDRPDAGQVTGQQDCGSGTTVTDDITLIVTTSCPSAGSFAGQFRAPAVCWTRPRKPPGSGMSAEPSRTWREQVVIDFLHLLTDRSVALLANPRGEPRLAGPPARRPGCWSCSGCRCGCGIRSSAR